jgi:hypothetical protein
MALQNVGFTDCFGLRLVIGAELESINVWRQISPALRFQTCRGRRASKTATFCGDW